MEYGFYQIYSITREHTVTVLFQKYFDPFKQEPQKGQTNLFRLGSFLFVMVIVF